jgi:hypothetical protein
MALPPVTITSRLPNSRTGRREIWEATTPGWVFHRTEETGTPWYAEATDTHLAEAFPSLLAARRAAASNLRAVMQFNARRALIRDGQLASSRALARYRCACGGLLTDTPDARGYRHIDGCLDCVGIDHRGRAEDPHATELATCAAPVCHAAKTHTVCRDPQPLTCARCDSAPAWICIECGCGREYCCGGCCGTDL